MDEIVRGEEYCYKGSGGSGKYKYFVKCIYLDLHFRPPTFSLLGIWNMKSWLIARSVFCSVAIFNPVNNFLWKHHRFAMLEIASPLWVRNDT